jgi:uncharacterized protein YprB with RNaseH-like and TPR domain
MAGMLALGALRERRRPEPHLDVLEYNREDVMNLLQLERIVVGVGLELECRAECRVPRTRAES